MVLKMNNSLTLGLLETDFKTLTLWDENTKILLILHLYAFCMYFLFWLVYDQIVHGRTQTLGSDLNSEPKFHIKKLLFFLWTNKFKNKKIACCSDVQIWKWNPKDKNIALRIRLVTQKREDCPLLEEITLSWITKFLGSALEQSNIKQYNLDESNFHGTSAKESDHFIHKHNALRGIYEKLTSIEWK